jgi:hypothetical protein
MDKDESREDDTQWSLSPILITKYAGKSSRLIRSIERNIFVVIGVVAALATISVIDAFEILGITDLIGENLDDPIIAILSLISLAALIPILRLSFKSKKTLEEWAEMFEYNSIRNSLTMSLTSGKKEDILNAVAETVEELANPLLEYLHKGEIQESYDKELGGYTFDVLLDASSVRKEQWTELKRVLEDYGAVIIKIIDGKVGKDELQTFSSALRAYAARAGHHDAVGLAIMVGKDVDQDANTGFAKKGKIVLIEQP